METDTQTAEQDWTDAKGARWPSSLVKPIDKLRTDLVNRAIQRAKGLRETMATFKADTMAEIAAFVELSAAEYDTAMGGKKGNLTLRSFDGLREVRVQVADRLAFDERLQVAEKLVGECVADWSAEARPELKLLVQSAFKTDKEGNVSTGAVLALRRIAIDDERWHRAMKAIADGIVSTGSKSYVRFYERDTPEGQERAISLDLAKL
ncbi:MAG TPA: DUF3164 family protein [Azospirillum sp.]|nr:DUF3164 family protein [Azospirillum sp.]